MDTASDNLRKSGVSDQILEYKDGFFASRWVHKFTQKLLLIYIYIVSFAFAKIKIEGKENVINIKKGPLLVISNHKSYLDPLLIGTCFPFFSKLYPLRYMALDKFFETFFKRIIFKSIASFPSFYGKGLDKSLNIPLKLLERGEVVVFFPEGACVRADHLSSPKRGIGALARQFPTVPILPVAISGSYNFKKSLFSFRPAQIKIKIGKLFYFADKQLGLTSDENSSQVLMGEIEKLYKQIT